jgi:hypothetical protein
MPGAKPGEGKKRALPMPKPGKPKPGPVKPKPKGGIMTPKERKFIEEQKQLPRRPTKPRTLEEKKFIMDQLKKNPGRGTPRGKGGIVDPKRTKLTPEQMKAKQAQSNGLVKNGKVTERAITRNEQKGGVTGMLPGKPRDLDNAKMPSYIRKPKPIVRRGR